MKTNPTNQTLRELLRVLGFERGALTDKMHRVFRHPESGCTAILPDNRDDQPASAANLLGLRDHLAYSGHLSEADFDRYLWEGKLPAASA